MESKGIAKTKLLSETELKRLRERVQKRFLSRDPDRPLIPANTFLGSYEPLRDDILLVIPEAHSSVSPTRLRKLFHYTNPAVCAPEHLEKPSFGKDFLEALEQYAAHPRTLVGNGGRKKWWVVVVGILTLCLLGSTWCLHIPKDRKIVDHFDDTSLEGLKNEGWEFEDFDSTLWFPQNRSGMLTLRTARGDYWYTPPDTPIIRNLIYREISDCPCFKLTFKIVDFRPSENFQQVGVFFLNDKRERDHNIRVTNAVGGIAQKLQVIKREHGQAYELGEFLRDTEKNPPIDSVWIAVVKRNNEYEFFYNLRNEYGPFQSFAKMTFDFKPAYIGIGAFNGIRQYDFGPFNTSPSTPAYIDYLVFEPCKIYD